MRAPPPNSDKLASASRVGGSPCQAWRRRIQERDDDCAVLLALRVSEGEKPHRTRTEPEHDDFVLDVDRYTVDAVTAAPAALVLPGGGFREHTAHDGEGYARWLNTLGIAAVVLRYRLRPDPFPVALQQARAALSALQRGDLLENVDTDRTGVIGSSAGGLLAGLLATGAVLSVEQPPATVPRPTFHIQSYGLASLALIPQSAVEALLADKISLAAELSPANHVDSDTPPTFVWTTAQDPPGLPNALEWARVLAEHDVRMELHIYPDGGHGLGLADGVAYGPHGHQAAPHTAQWTDACERWLRHLGVIRGAELPRPSRHAAP